MARARACGSKWWFRNFLFCYLAAFNLLLVIISNGREFTEETELLLRFFFKSTCAAINSVLHKASKLTLNRKIRI